MIDTLTAEGVNPSSRSVFEKSVRENCFLQRIRQSNDLLPKKKLGKDLKEPWEVHGKINSLDIDRECLTGQILRNFSQSCKMHHHEFSVSAREGPTSVYTLTRVAGESGNVRLSAARHTNLQPGLREILPSYRRLRWRSRRRRRRLLGKDNTLPQCLFPRRLFSSLPLVGLDLGFNLCPCLCVLEFLCVPSSLDQCKRYPDHARLYLASSFPYPSYFPSPLVLLVIFRHP